MDDLRTSAFDLPHHLAAKADLALIADDEKHFAAIAQSLEQSVSDCPAVSTPRAVRPAAPARRRWTGILRSTG